MYVRMAVRWHIRMSMSMESDDNDHWNGTFLL